MLSVGNICSSLVSALGKGEDSSSSVKSPEAEGPAIVSCGCSKVAASPSPSHWSSVVSTLGHWESKDEDIMATDPRDNSHWLHVLVFLLLLPAHEVIECLSQGHVCMFLCSRITLCFFFFLVARGSGAHTSQGGLIPMTSMQPVTRERQTRGQSGESGQILTEKDVKSTS